MEINDEEDEDEDKCNVLLTGQDSNDKRHIVIYIVHSQFQFQSP
jgi:hypothetical protein